MFFEISRKLTSGKSFRKFILSKCPNDWTITMIWRSFIGNLEILFLPKFQKKILQKCDDHCIIPSDKTKFQTLQREKAIPTLSRVLFYCGIDVSRNRFKHFMQSEHRDKVGSFFDVTRITLLYRQHVIRSSEN